MNRFTPIECAAFNGLRFNPRTQPHFDPMRWCLWWPDEEPPIVSQDTYDKFIDLIIVRSFIHLGKPQAEWYVIEPTTYFVDAWQAAQEEIPLWPGFKRQQLNRSERRFFEAQRRRDLSEFI